MKSDIEESTVAPMTLPSTLIYTVGNNIRYRPLAWLNL